MGKQRLVAWLTPKRSVRIIHKNKTTASDETTCCCCALASPADEAPVAGLCDTLVSVLQSLPHMDLDACRSCSHPEVWEVGDLQPPSCGSCRVRRDEEDPWVTAQLGVPVTACGSSRKGSRGLQAAEVRLGSWPAAPPPRQPESDQPCPV